MISWVSPPEEGAAGAAAARPLSNADEMTVLVYIVEDVELEVRVVGWWKKEQGSGLERYIKANDLASQALSLPHDPPPSRGST